jgi:peptide/nickel transport system ATP-binding protein
MLTAAEIDEWNSGQPAAAPVLISVVDLAKVYDVRRGILRRRIGQTRALDRVSLEFRPGEVIGIVGGAGSGKSTLGRILAGREAPSTGAVKMGAEAAPGARAERAISGGVGLLPFSAQRELPRRRTVRSLVARAARRAGATRPAARALALGVLNEVGLDPRIYSALRVSGLADSDVWRVALAVALAEGRRIVVLDDFDSADPAFPVAARGRLIRDLSRRHQVTFVMLGRQLRPLVAIADWIAVLHLGRIIELASSEAIRSGIQHPATRDLAEATAPQLEPEGDGGPVVPRSDPPGCHFHPHCRFAELICTSFVPAAASVGRDHMIACHMASAGSGHGRAGRGWPHGVVPID